MKDFEVSKNIWLIAVIIVRPVLGTVRENLSPADITKGGWDIPSPWHIYHRVHRPALKSIQGKGILLKSPARGRLISAFI